ncbi:hypothetical protein FI667_g8206, partial [Globisporangium splendens]
MSRSTPSRQARLDRSDLPVPFLLLLRQALFFPVLKSLASPWIGSDRIGTRALGRLIHTSAILFGKSEIASCRFVVSERASIKAVLTLPLLVPSLSLTKQNALVVLRTASTKEKSSDKYQRESMAKKGGNEIAMLIRVLEKGSNDKCDITIDDITSNPVSCGCLLDFCQKGYCAENLNFFMAVDKFKDECALLDFRDPESVTTCKEMADRI